MTRERKILATILAVGLSALLVDWLVVGSDGEPPAANAAWSSPADRAAVHRAAPDVAATTRLNADALADIEAVVNQGVGRRLETAPSVAERLNQAAERLDIDPDQVRQAFAAPPSWLPKMAATGQPAAPAASAQAQQFAQRHRLEAVVLSGDASFVVVDGRTVRRGQSLDGLTLVEIQSRAAVFASDQMRVTLRMPDGDR
jgi:hypothetical protein